MHKIRKKSNMSIETLLIYLTLVFAVTSTPGPAVLFIISNTLSHGLEKSIVVAIGNILGLLFVGIASITGLGIIVQSSEYIFNIIKYMGAIYLIYLGIKLILKKDFTLNHINDKTSHSSISTRKVFLQSFLVAVSNPKVIVFLTALFPQFIILENALIPQFSLLIGIYMFSSFGCLLLYALLADRAKNWLNKPSRVKTMNRTSGTIFIGFGTLLATSSNK